ncbi:MAG TPA: SDR family oxidoreductase [Thermoanaerobaculia bacterium]|jgi:NAD(P)-dependent dehydrogenase (short-subunit alcohol dehydrogenase family)|nr:SDR family oxidoreductase [Thermoanaerobaculia bacterium]
MRVAVVTGASRGIGLEICRQLGAAGYTVVLTARDPDKAARGLDRLRREGIDARFQALDVTDAARARQVAAAVAAELGRLDALVNNAAIALDARATVAALEPDLMRQTLETNLLGALHCCQAFLPLMLQQGYGRIVNVSSGRGSFSRLGSGGPSYRISKTALNALTVILADELKDSNVLVNAMTTGWVRTRLGGLKAPRSIAEGAETAVWLAMLPDDGPRGKFWKDREELAW